MVKKKLGVLSPRAEAVIMEELQNRSSLKGNEIMAFRRNIRAKLRKR